MENGETDAGVEETWEEKVKPDEEPGGGSLAESGGPEPDEGQEELEEEEELPTPKPPPAKPDAPKKEHVNVVFIGHVGELPSKRHLWHCFRAGAGVLRLGFTEAADN